MVPCAAPPLRVTYRRSLREWANAFPTHIFVAKAPQIWVALKCTVKAFAHSRVTPKGASLRGGGVVTPTSNSRPQPLCVCEMGGNQSRAPDASPPPLIPALSRSASARWAVIKVGPPNCLWCGRYLSSAIFLAKGCLAVSAAMAKWRYVRQLVP